MSATVRLDAAEYNVLWRRRGDKPLILGTLDHGVTWSERAAIDAAARGRLRAAGHIDDHDVPEPALADVFEVLARPDAEVDVRVWTREGRRGTTACARGELAVVAALDDADGLRLSPASPGALPGALLDHVPDTPALAGSPMTVPAEALAAPGWESGLRRAAVPRPTVQRLMAMGARPPRRKLQFGVARRDPLGRRRRGGVLDVIDTAEGRVALRRVGTQLVVRPADRAWLRDELARMLGAAPT